MLTRAGLHSVQRARFSLRLMDANGQRIPSDKVVVLEVSLGARGCRVKFLVVDNLSVPCILGCDFLDRHVSSIECEQQVVRLRNGDQAPINSSRGVPPLSSKKKCRPFEFDLVRVARKVTIPPSHQASVLVTAKARAPAFLRPIRLC